MVKIKQNINKNSITAVSSKNGGNVSAGADASIYYSNLSKEWACKMPASVDGTEYSAKYYMEKTKQKALDSVSDIGDAKDNAILALQNAGDEILDSVEEILDSAEEIYNQTESKANEILNLILNYANTTLSNVSSIDSGSAVQTALNNKADEDLSNVTSADMTAAMVSSNTPVITETYINGTSWYKVYSNGWCEQGGYKQRSGSTTSITLLKNYTNTNYSIQVTLEAAAANKYAAVVTAKTKSSISVYNGHSEAYFYWCCAGYIS